MPVTTGCWARLFSQQRFIEGCHMHELWQQPPLWPPSIVSYFSLNIHPYNQVSFKESKYDHVTACCLMAFHLFYGLPNLPCIYFSHPLPHPHFHLLALTSYTPAGVLFPPSTSFSLLNELPSSCSLTVPPFWEPLLISQTKLGPPIKCLQNTHTSFQTM